MKRCSTVKKKSNLTQCATNVTPRAMKTFILLLSLISSFAISNPARASYANYHYTYYGLFHFNAVYYGHKVKSVKVHAGVLMESQSMGSYGWSTYNTWSNPTDIQLTQMPDGHFFGKNAIKAEGYASSGPHSIALGLAFEYFITLDKGTTVIVKNNGSDFVIEPNGNDYIYEDSDYADIIANVQKMNDAFNTTTDSAQTKVQAVRKMSF